MRFLIKATLPVQPVNDLMAAGKFAETMQSILADAKPEATYFYEDGGARTGILIVDISDPSKIPGLAEPWFMAFNASVEFHPVMTPADLGKASTDIDNAAKRYYRGG
jgi:hypothetical protein